MAQVPEQFYQTNELATLSLMAKKCNKEDVSVQFETNKVEVKYKLPTGEEMERNFEPRGEIKPSDSSFKVTAYKIEVYMAKAESGEWKTLEKPTGEETAAAKMSGPYSSNKDWNQFASEVKKEEEEEKPEGDAALNKLFQSIYSNADPDTQKAMMKSFQESNGTVLSTNWNEVGKGKVECKPPEGMELAK